MRRWQNAVHLPCNFYCSVIGFCGPNTPRKKKCHNSPHPRSLRAPLNPRDCQLFFIIARPGIIPPQLSNPPPSATQGWVFFPLSRRRRRALVVVRPLLHRSSLIGSLCSFDFILFLQTNRRSEAPSPRTCLPRDLPCRPRDLRYLRPTVSLVRLRGLRFLRCPGHSSSSSSTAQEVSPQMITGPRLTWGPRRVPAEWGADRCMHTFKNEFLSYCSPKVMVMVFFSERFLNSVNSSNF